MVHMQEQQVEEPRERITKKRKKKNTKEIMCIHREEVMYWLRDWRNVIYRSMSTEGTERGADGDGLLSERDETDEEEDWKRRRVVGSGNAWLLVLLIAMPVLVLLVEGEGEEASSEPICIDKCDWCDAVRACFRAGEYGWEVSFSSTARQEKEVQIEWVSVEGCGGSGVATYSFWAAFCRRHWARSLE